MKAQNSATQACNARIDARCSRRTALRSIREVWPAGYRTLLIIVAAISVGKEFGFAIRKHGKGSDTSMGGRQTGGKPSEIIPATDCGVVWPSRVRTNMLRRGIYVKAIGSIP